MCSVQPCLDEFLFERFIIIDYDVKGIYQFFLYLNHLLFESWKGVNNWLA